jgi:hypothetical protein
MHREIRLAVSAAACLALAGIGSTASADTTRGGSTLDSTLFATYTAQPDGASVQFTVCGSLPGSDGCYGSETLGPFEHACAVMEGVEKTKGDVVSRAIYVLDKRATKKAPLQLYVYERTDTINGAYDTVHVSLTKQVSLGITGGPSSRCTMAGNPGYVFAGTDASNAAAVIDKTTLAASESGGFGTLVSVTADDHGFVAVHFADGFYIAGGGEEGGGLVAGYYNQVGSCGANGIFAPSVLSCRGLKRPPRQVWT